MASIVVMTPNPAIDVTYRVDTQLIGETNRVREIGRAPGGKGVNVARALAALGRSSASVLPLGGTPGEWMRRAIAALPLNAHVTEVAGDTRSTVTVTAPDSHPTVYSEAGPVITTAEWDALRASLARALDTAASDGPGALVISGSLPPGSSPDLIATWVSDARSRGLLTVADVSGDALLAAARAGADVVKPNLHELLEATGAGDLDSGCRGLLALGAKLVVISRGELGLVARDANQEYSAPAVDLATFRRDGDGDGATTFNPTGAGDAATAALTAALLDGASVPEALRWAAALGAAAVLRPRAGEVDIDAFSTFMHRDENAVPGASASPLPHPAHQPAGATP